MRGGHEYRLHINDKAERLLGAPREIIEISGRERAARHQCNRLMQCRLDDEAQVIWFISAPFIVTLPVLGGPTG